MQEQIALDEPRAHFQAAIAPARAADPLHRALFADLKLYLPGDLLTLTDRMSMAHSLEVRVPFLDHRLLEYAATIPPELKLRGMERKHILKRAVRDLLPPEILNRRKMGFSVPLTVWFRGELRRSSRTCSPSPRFATWASSTIRQVRRVLDDHFAAARQPRQPDLGAHRPSCSGIATTSSGAPTSPMRSTPDAGSIRDGR